VTNREGVIAFSVLGPLEVRTGETKLPLGGAKQRAVLAALLLRAGEVVSVERLIDEVWGESPPPSAAHSLEAYVSRLRQLLNGHGPSLVRRGPGYVFLLAGATLDADEFEALADEGWSAAAAGRFQESSRLATRSLELWRGPALADVALASSGRGEAERLEELKLRTFEQLFDAELALGHHQALVGRLQTLVGQNPYRERFVAQLMLVLYRCGRHAEALEIYEQTRRRLDDDLGLQPSTELRELSGQIVRQEPQLLRPNLHVRAANRHTMPGPSRARRIGSLILAASVTAAVMAFTASGSASYEGSSAAPAHRVALVLPGSPETSLDEPRVRETADAFRSSFAARGLQGHVLVADEDDASGAQTEHVMSLLAEGSYALAIVVGETNARALAPLVRRSSATRFVFVDVSLATLSLAGAPNATGLPFADHETSHLMGFLSATVPLHVDRPRTRADAVSIVVSRETPRAERLVDAFRRGARRAAPGATVRVAYVTDETNKTACERLANDLIDKGSDVVYAVAGECSSPVLAVVKLRGVWGIRANDDPYAYGPHILATTYKRWEQAVGAALNGFALGTLPRGRDIVLGLADDYAVDAWGSGVPASESVWSKVARLCTSIRERTEDDAP
jgi:SARP family transcriptional regulator, regulator of embCAB operon